MKFGRKNPKRETNHETIDSFLKRGGVIVQCPSKSFQFKDFNPVQPKGSPMNLGDNSGCLRVGARVVL